MIHGHLSLLPASNTHAHPLLDLHNKQERLATNDLENENENANENENENEGETSPFESHRDRGKETCVAVYMSLVLKLECGR